MASTAGRVVWHDLVTGDADTAIAFYTGLFGWEIEYAEMGGGFRYPMIKAGDQTHGGFAPAPDGVPSHWMAHVHVPDTDAAVGRASARGGSVLSPPADIPDVGRFGVIADPAGGVLSLFTPTDDGFAATGVFAWDELIADDAAAAEAFYTDVVGWTTSQMQLPDWPTYTLFQSGADDTGAAGLLAKRPDMPGPPAAWVTYIGTGDADATVARARELGGSVLAEPFDVPTIGRIAIVADTVGAVFGVFMPFEPQAA